MKFRFKDAVTWKYTIISVSKIVEEAGFKVSDEGIKLRAMDPSGVALVDFFIPREVFQEYNVQGEVIVGMNMEDFSRILRRAKRGDELLLEILPDGRLGILLEGKGSRRFILPSIDLSYHEVPEISFEETFKCKTLPRLFKDVVRELEPISDSVEFYAPEDSDTLYVHARGEIAEAEVALSASSGALIEYESTSEAKSKYTVGYLVDIAAASQVAEVLTIGFGVETPLHVAYELPQGGMLQFYVAPRTD